MFYGLATKKIRSTKVTVEHFLSDIQTLNQCAQEGKYELTAISYHAYPYVADRYRLMASGSSIGDNYGPMAVAKAPLRPEGLKGKRIAVPGKMTTAYLTMRLFEPDFEAVIMPFDRIVEAVNEGAVDAGLIIHEGQLTYSQMGLQKVVDLGVWFKGKYGLPLPLGANALRRDLPDDIQTECCRLMRDSIQFSLDNREQALEYALEFARDMERGLADKFVGMYVNHYTVDCGEIIPRAAQKLLDLGHEAGLIPHRVELEFIR